MNNTVNPSFGVVAGNAACSGGTELKPIKCLNFSQAQDRMEVRERVSPPSGGLELTAAEGTAGAEQADEPFVPYGNPVYHWMSLTARSLLAQFSGLRSNFSQAEVRARVDSLLRRDAGVVSLLVHMDPPTLEQALFRSTIGDDTLRKTLRRQSNREKFLKAVTAALETHLGPPAVRKTVLAHMMAEWMKTGVFPSDGIYWVQQYPFVFALFQNSLQHEPFESFQNRTHTRIQEAALGIEHPTEQRREIDRAVWSHLQYVRRSFADGKVWLMKPDLDVGTLSALHDSYQGIYDGLVGTFERYGTAGLKWDHYSPALMQEFLSLSKQLAKSGQRVHFRKIPQVVEDILHHYESLKGQQPHFLDEVVRVVYELESPGLGNAGASGAECWEVIDSLRAFVLLDALEDQDARGVAEKRILEGVRTYVDLRNKSRGRVEEAGSLGQACRKTDPLSPEFEQERVSCLGALRELATNDTSGLVSEFQGMVKGFIRQTKTRLPEESHYWLANRIDRLEDKIIAQAAHTQFNRPKSSFDRTPYVTAINALRIFRTGAWNVACDKFYKSLNHSTKFLCMGVANLGNSRAQRILNGRESYNFDALVQVGEEWGDSVEFLNENLELILRTNDAEGIQRAIGTTHGIVGTIRSVPQGDQGCSLRKVKIRAWLLRNTLRRYVEQLGGRSELFPAPERECVPDAVLQAVETLGGYVALHRGPKRHRSTSQEAERLLLHLVSPNGVQSQQAEEEQWQKLEKLCVKDLAEKRPTEKSQFEKRHAEVVQALAYLGGWKRAYGAEHRRFSRTLAEVETQLKAAGVKSLLVTDAYVDCIDTLVLATRRRAAPDDRNVSLLAPVDLDVKPTKRGDPAFKQLVDRAIRVSKTDRLKALARRPDLYGGLYGDIRKTLEQEL